MSFLSDLYAGAVMTVGFLVAPTLVVALSVRNIRDKAEGGWSHAISGISLVIGIVWLTGGVALVGWYVEFFRAHS